VPADEERGVAVTDVPLLAALNDIVWNDAPVAETLARFTASQVA